MCKNDFGRALRIILGMPVALFVLFIIWIIVLVAFIILCFIFVGGSMFGIKESIFNLIPGEGSVSLNNLCNDIIACIIGDTR